MKRLISILLFIPFCCFLSCSKENSYRELSPDQAFTLVQDALENGEDLTRADPDFMESNLHASKYVESGCVCFGDGDPEREIGFFLLRDERDLAAFKEEILAYLSRERESLASLAALYPQGALEARLALYQSPCIGERGKLLWYFVMDAQDTAIALDALRQA